MAVVAAGTWDQLRWKILMAIFHLSPRQKSSTNLVGGFAECSSEIAQEESYMIHDDRADIAAEHNHLLTIFIDSLKRLH